MVSGHSDKGNTFLLYLMVVTKGQKRVFKWEKEYQWEPLDTLMTSDARLTFTLSF